MRFNVDVFGSGSAIYKMTQDGKMLQTVAWADNSLVARPAFDELVKRYPGDRFQQKRKSWVERDSVEDR
jgi:hypothetical protein